jgi:hypothetical protein
VAIIAGWSSQTDDQARFGTVRHLGVALSADDVDALRLFLDTRFSEQDALDLQTFNSMKNEVLLALCRQQRLPTGLGFDLVRMFRDQNHDDVWRDYCIQFVGDYYQRLSSTATSDPEKQAILAAYWDATTITNKPIAGTSINALERLSRETPDLDRKQIATVALTMARDERVCPAARVTAIQVCSRLSCEDVLPTARALMAVGNQAMLRMSAIATVGDLGGAADEQSLTVLANDPDLRVRTAALAAVRRLRHRLGLGNHG